jgi:DNA replication protein
VSLKNLTTDDLIRIAIAGGGFRLDCRSRKTEDLIRIALAASNNNSRVVFFGASFRLVDELVKIAVAGKGSVSFED